MQVTNICHCRAALSCPIYLFPQPLSYNFMLFVPNLVLMWCVMNDLEVLQSLLHEELLSSCVMVVVSSCGHLI